MKPRLDTYRMNYGSQDSAQSQIWGSRTSLLSVFNRSKSTKRLVLVVGGLSVAAALIIGLAVGLSLRAKDATGVKLDYLREAGPNHWSEQMVSSAVFNHSAVSSDAQVCSEIGNYFLKKNGSAVDAAIATMLCAGLYAPQSMGIGGGFFMVIYNRTTQKATVIDAREVAPKAASENMYLANSNLSKDGPLSIAVPGELHGMATAHKLFGRIPWMELFQPIIQLCYQGTKVTPILAKALQEKREKLLKDPGSREVFFYPNSDKVLVEGDLVKRTALGRTLEIISQNGVDEFYKGQMGQDLVDELKQMGGILTMEDLNEYKSKIREPITVDLSNQMRLFSLPPPASGAVLANIMMVLDGYKFQEEPNLNPVTFYHRIIEAYKFGYSYRAELGDGDFLDMSQLVADLTSAKIAEEIRKKIWDNQTFPSEHYEPTWKYSMVEDHGTSHISVLAPDGDAVSATSTINLYFGSGILLRKSGIILNDEMDDYSSPNAANYFGVQPSKSNYIAPGKRPVSSIVAAIFTNSSTGEVRLVTGAAGGTKITSATAYVAVRHLMTNENLTKAVVDRRLHHQLHPSYIEYEPEFPMEIIEGLRKLGHNLTESTTFAVVNPIAKVNGKVNAVGDARKRAGTAGF